MSSEEEVERRRRRNDLLRQYYTVSSTSGGYQSMPTDPCNLNAMGFDPDMYLSQMVRDKTLTELMEEEKALCEATRALDADMQSLVYENYYKFIRATDTIRKMKDNFNSTAKEMELLAEKMTNITQLSSELDTTLHTRRHQINKLTQTHRLLKKLQYLFEMPQRLTQWIADGAYLQAVRQYRKARVVLNRYADMSSFQSIRNDCQRIIGDLREQLWEKLRSDDDPQKLAELIRLLWQLGEPPSQLRAEFFKRAGNCLDTDLAALERQIVLHNQRQMDDCPVSTDVPYDVVEFVDEGCSVFLSDLCLFVTVHDELFIQQAASDFEDTETGEEEALEAPEPAVKVAADLKEFVRRQMTRYFEVVATRMRLEKEGGDNAEIVRALDRFHRRLQAMDRLMAEPSIEEAGLAVVCSVASGRVHFYLEALQQQFEICVAALRRVGSGDAVPGPARAPVVTDTAEGGDCGGKTEREEGFEALIQAHITTLVDKMRSSLTALQPFVATDITFTQKTQFRQRFCPQDIREGLVVAFFRLMMQRCTELVEQASSPPTLLLLLSRLTLDVGASAVDYLMTLADEMYLIDTIAAEAGRSRSSAASAPVLTPVSRLSEELRGIAQRLMDGYVRAQGLAVSQMLRKSVETRDWLNTIEPRHVRAVMKRLVEDVSRMDVQVAQLYGGGPGGDKRDRSSDSSRRCFPAAIPPPAKVAAKSAGNRSQWSLTPSTLDQHLMNNIQKLFSEKIEVFTSVALNRESVITGVIKIGLKTLLECVRMRTFGRYGLQQMQVDCHYLHVHLWRYVSDENLVAFLLDEIVVSVAHRCLDPVLMEGSIVELIAERS